MEKAKCKPESIKPAKKSKTTKPQINVIIGKNGVDFNAVPISESFLGKTVFRIEYENVDGEPCINYVDNGNKNITFEDKNGDYILFNLDGDEVTEAIYNTCLQKLTSKKKISSSHEELKKGLTVLRSCKKDIDLMGAQRVLSILNRELSMKCPNLILKLAPFYEYLEPVDRYGENNHLCASGRFYETIILSLCKDGRCVSTIELTINNDTTITINSKTTKEEEGKKYNKMLRSILIIIATKIPHIQSIRSVAINKISTWLLIKYSKAFVEPGNPFETYLIDNKKNIESLTQDDISQYYEIKHDPVVLIVPLSEETIDNAYREFKKLTANIENDGEIKC
jgi:hypothetical protein